MCRDDGQIEAGEIVVITTGVYSDAYICGTLRACRAIPAEEWNAVRDRFDVDDRMRSVGKAVDAHGMIAEMVRLGMLEATPSREIHADDPL